MPSGMTGHEWKGDWEVDSLTSRNSNSKVTVVQPTNYQVRLVSRHEVAERTMALYFDRPTDFVFQAGQFIDLMLLGPPIIDSKGNTRAFTIASAPSDNHLMVVTRLRNTAFKRELAAMPLESSVNIEGPFGNMTLPEKVTRPIVFLAGGIGITPFRSMVVHAAQKKLPHRLYLFYSNRRPEGAAFLEELQALQQINSQYTFIGTMTQMHNSHRSWHGNTGYLNMHLIRKVLPEIESPIYFIVGPPKMVRGLRTMLETSGIRYPDIRTEEFVGY